MEKIEVVPNFILETSQNNHNHRNGRWIYVGRLVQEKGILTLLKNWPDDFLLDIYGQGPLRKDVEAYAAKNSHIKFFENVKRKELLSMLSCYEGAVFPSHWMEGMPLTVLEFMNASLPIVALEGTSVSDFIRRGKAGIVLQTLSSESLSLAFKAISTDHNEFRKNSRKTFQENFTEDVWMKRMARVIQDLG
jgi:glycosyltransferase involved in cell wall biosynthesis